MPRRAALALGGAASGVVLLILTWYLAFHVGFVRRADLSVLQGFADLAQPRVDALAHRIAGLCNPHQYVFLAAVPLGVALVRRRRRSALAIATILLGANTTTHLLKPALGAVRSGPVIDGGYHIFYSASWPSGHATAAMTLALCLVLAVPSRWRPLAAATGAVFTIAVVYSFLTLVWHLPSDVLGGFLVALTWTALAVGCVWLVEGRSGAPAGVVSRHRRQSWSAILAPPGLALAGALGLLAVIAVARPHEVSAYARTHTAFVLGAAGIAAAALVIATGMTLVLSRSSGGSDLAPTEAQQWPA